MATFQYTPIKTLCETQKEYDDYLNEQRDEITAKAEHWYKNAAYSVPACNTVTVEIETNTSYSLTQVSNYLPFQNEYMDIVL